MPNHPSRPKPANRRGYRWSQEEKEYALSLLEQGLSYYSVAKETGLSDSHLALKFPGYGRRPHGAPEDYVQFAIPDDKLLIVEKLLADGLSLAEVARASKVNINHLYANYPNYAYTPSEVAAVAHWKRHHIQDSVEGIPT